jgi:dihydropyrimidinase
MSATEKARSRFGDNATLIDWAETHPEIAEEEAVIRIAYFAQKLEQPAYIVHVSTAGAVEKLREIRKTNTYVLCETVSPYLMLDPERYRSFTAKMEPPIRGGRHAEALWQGLSDGVIDTIGTDNVSWSLSQKNPGKRVWDALPGYPAMATHLPSVLTGGCIRRGFDLAALTAKMTSAPAKAFGIYPRKGTLLPGSDADMVLVDLQSIRKVDPKKLRSRSEYSIYEDQHFTGWPTATILGGQIAAAGGEAVGGTRGRLIR